MRALTADYDVTTYAWKFNLPACMRLWPFYFWVVSTGDTGLGLGRVNLVCVATERSLLTTSTLLQQVKNKHLLLLLLLYTEHRDVPTRGTGKLDALHVGGGVADSPPTAVTRTTMKPNIPSYNR